MAAAARFLESVRAGKVFDTLAEYEAFRKSGKDILNAASAKAKAEAAEEAGVVVDDVTLFKKSTLGSTVEWDLYVFEAIKWHKHKDGQILEASEQADGLSVDWYHFNQVEFYCSG